MSTTALKIGTLDDYLNRICEEIQLRETQFNMAVKRYRRVGEWLTEKETPMDHLSPEIFPQGSMLQRTTIRPMRVGKEVVPFDIDTVCRCDFDPFAKTSQSLYGSVLARLIGNDDFKHRIEEAQKEIGTSGKCVRLAYTDDDFYLDVVPTCKDPSDPEGIRLYMCNPDKWQNYTKPIETWRRTDPFRFAAWLQVKCEIGRRLVEKRAVASVAPVPPQEEADVKAPLRRVVQLLKRQRDLDFLGDKCRPTSIMLTTLAGRHYRGEESIADGLETVLNGISAQINAAGSGRITVPNPADEMAPHDGGIEDLAKPLDEAAYSKFCKMIEKMRTALAAARSAHGVPKLYPVLARAFGESVVKRAFNSAEEAVKKASAAGLLGASVAGSQIHVLTEAKAYGAVQPVRGSDFHRNN
jgi:hypothetical protein